MLNKSPDDAYPQPLTGEEIIIDLMEQLASKLRADCRLRDSDSYANGYYAKVTYHIEAKGLDSEVIAGEHVAGTLEETPGEDTDILDGELEVPVEPDLDAVRARSEQAIPSFADGKQEGPVTTRRRYSAGSPVVGGGASGETLDTF